jgi:hypothetical protein
MGCVGKDRYAEIMMEKAKSVGLNVCYQFNTEQHTGKFKLGNKSSKKPLSMFIY